MTEKKPPHPDDSMIDCEKGSPRWKPELAPGVEEWADELIAEIVGGENSDNKSTKEAKK